MRYTIFLILYLSGCCETKSNLQFNELYVGLNSSKQGTSSCKIILYDDKQIVISGNQDTLTYSIPYSSKYTDEFNQFSQFIKSNNDSDYTSLSILDSINNTMFGSQKIELRYETQSEKENQSKIWFSTNINDTSYHFYFGSYSNSIVFEKVGKIIGILKEMGLIEKEYEI